MNDINQTMRFNVDKEKEKKAEEIILTVYKALEEKGYNPINQMIGYILSGDPTYITSYNNARTIIRELERDEILEELIKKYLEK
ncbi:hypothetical protein Curi_c13360 [Gottschalkia acidurici 9a]|uniref:UPF0297 protein Curi_c13360 n=1 Tax=Gottschalkia acidurici (strain ATCC 7906 / DSM 604 / BCRC 14475 / CIP 104303 / KCTC 5404 / NCIMB 10678 / 9a) TaxID=1128398 RepID=K0AZY1_GOTA9|nr:IreB family regulatory phosphoprotein [Gottschalkia acidurici]AFS78347.1 hypothetical protein Curi_c13360 [Gottschalkia acidurici 9a]